MKRLRLFFAVPLLLLFFPLWRALDYQLVVLPSAYLYTLCFLMITLITVAIPMRLIFPKLRKVYLLAATILLGVPVFLGSPLSGMTTKNYESRQCGLSTFGGLLYPVRSIFPPAHEDDLEVRNQLCWIRKMIVRMPDEIDDVNELRNYLDLLREKLLSPQVKYKVSLPLIAFLHGLMSGSLSGPALQSVEIGKMFVDSLHFWKSQYTVEVGAIEYPWYAWPHSAFIQFEYGIIERNWETIVDGMSYEDH